MTPVCPFKLRILCDSLIMTKLLSDFIVNIFKSLLLVFMTKNVFHLSTLKLTKGKLPLSQYVHHMEKTCFLGLLLPAVIN